MDARIKGGIEGAIVGWTLGSGLAPRPLASPVKSYNPVPSRMAPSACIDAWLVFEQHLRNERPLLSLGGSILTYWEWHQDGFAFGQKNLEEGFAGPLAGRVDNPTMLGANGIVRSLFWGFAYSGKPDWAFRAVLIEASLNHGGSGALVPAIIAKWLADPSLVTETSLADAVLACFVNGDPEAQIVFEAASIPSCEKPLDVFADFASKKLKSNTDSAIAALCAIVFALNQGKFDFDKSLGIAVSLGVCPGVVGAATAAILGAKHETIPGEWLSPLGQTYVGTTALKNVSVPATIGVFVELLQNLKAYEMLAPVFGPFTSAEILNQNASVAQQGGLVMYVDYPKGVKLQDAVLGQIAVAVTNMSGEDVEIDPAWTTPLGWQAVQRAEKGTLKPRQTWAAHIIAKSDRPALETQCLTIKLGQLAFNLPLLGMAEYWTCGPFMNHKGAGMDKTEEAELEFDTKAKFVGRAETTAQWQLIHMHHQSLDIEPLFNSGPGTVLLRREVELCEPLTLNVEAQVPQRVSVNGTQCERLEKGGTNQYRLEAGKQTLLLKFGRDLEKLPSVGIWFTREDGSLSHAKTVSP